MTGWDLTAAMLAGPLVVVGIMLGVCIWLMYRWDKREKKK